MSFFFFRSRDGRKMENKLFFLISKIVVPKKENAPEIPESDNQTKLSVNQFPTVFPQNPKP